MNFQSREKTADMNIMYLHLHRAVTAQPHFPLFVTKRLNSLLSRNRTA